MDTCYYVGTSSSTWRPKFRTWGDASWSIDSLLQVPLSVQNNYQSISFFPDVFPHFFQATSSVPPIFSWPKLPWFALLSPHRPGPGIPPAWSSRGPSARAGRLGCSSPHWSWRSSVQHLDDCGRWKRCGRSGTFWILIHKKLAEDDWKMDLSIFTVTVNVYSLAFQRLPKYHGMYCSLEIPGARWCAIDSLQSRDTWTPFIAQLSTKYELASIPFINGCPKISMFMVSICWRELLPIHTWKSISREAALGTDCAAGIVFFIPRGQKTPSVVKHGENHGKVMEKMGQIWYKYGKSPVYWGCHRKIIYKWWIFHCHVWLLECKGEKHLKRKPWFLPCYRRRSSAKFAWNKAWLRSGGHKSSLPVPDVTRCYQLPEVHKNNNVEIDCNILEHGKHW